MRCLQRCDALSASLSLQVAHVSTALWGELPTFSLIMMRSSHMRNAAAACAEVCVRFPRGCQQQAYTCMILYDICIYDTHATASLAKRPKLFSFLSSGAKAARMRLLQTALSRSLDEARCSGEQDAKNLQQCQARRQQVFAGPPLHAQPVLVIVVMVEEVQIVCEGEIPELVRENTIRIEVVHCFAQNHLKSVFSAEVDSLACLGRLQPGCRQAWLSRRRHGGKSVFSCIPSPRPLRKLHGRNGHTVNLTLVLPASSRPRNAQGLSQPTNPAPRVAYSHAQIFKLNLCASCS